MQSSCSKAACKCIFVRFEVSGSGTFTSSLSSNVMMLIRSFGLDEWRREGWREGGMEGGNKRMGCKEGGKAREGGSEGGNERERGSEGGNGRESTLHACYT